MAGLPFLQVGSIWAEDTLPQRAEAVRGLFLLLCSATAGLAGLLNPLLALIRVEAGVGVAPITAAQLRPAGP